MRTSTLKKLVVLAAATLGLAAGGAAHAGSVFLTGHDVDLHDGQNGYDVVILDWLRGAGTASEIAAASYRVGLIRSTDAINPAGGFVGGVLDGAPLWAGGVTTRDPTEFADAAAFSAFLGTIDVLVLASFTGCGGCDLSAGDSTVFNGFAPQLAAAFNDAGLDVYGNSGNGLATYYDFLPPGAVATGASISGSNGFECTAAGVAIGIDCDAAGVSNINGFPTHNRFTSAAAAFTVFETRPLAGSTEIISIGVRDARIIDGGVVDGGAVPEPGALALLGLGALGIALMRRRRQQ